mgnify:CR=1 FL=1
MGDLTNNERVAVEIQALSDVFEHGTKKLDTDEEFGTAFLEFILGRERIRRGVKAVSYTHLTLPTIYSV